MATVSKKTGLYDRLEENEIKGDETIDIEERFNRMRCERILPILLYCQAQKGDLRMYENWTYHESRNKKLFYAYYSGLFCRILCYAVISSNITIALYNECKALLDKYNWYDIQDVDLELFVSGGTYGCEVPEALAFIDGVDNVAWKDSGFGNGRDAVCLMLERASWTFADVRGSVKLNK